MATDSVARAIALAAKAASSGGGSSSADVVSIDFPHGQETVGYNTTDGITLVGQTRLTDTEGATNDVATDIAIPIFPGTGVNIDAKEDGTGVTISATGGLSTIQAGIGTSSIVMNHDDANTNVASGNYSVAQGYGTKATGQGAFAAGYSQAAGNVIASGDGAVAIGSTASSLAGTGVLDAQGRGSLVCGVASAGYSLTTTNFGAIALGAAVNNNIKASGSGALVYGYPSSNELVASNTGALAGGAGGYAAGQYSIAISPSTASAQDLGSIAIGDNVNAYGAYQWARGRSNIIDTSNTYADIFGIDNQTNGYTLDWQGNATFAGTVNSASGADYAEYFEWKDKNVNSEDRIGYIVTLDGDKIVKAKAGDDILGIISGCATVIGDNAEWNWQGRFERDEFGRIIYDQVEQFIDTPDPDWEPDPEKPDEEVPMIKKSLGYFPVPRENADYDPTKAYENRSNRPEWDTVGMMGKIYVRDDGTGTVNGYVTISDTTDGIATKSESRTSMRVMERVNDHIIRVCFK